MNVTVYLSSRYSIAEEYQEAVTEVALGVGQMGCSVIYGGSNAGQMHVFASLAKKSGATVTGVVPKAFANIADPVADRMIYTKNLGERKNVLFEQGDVFVVLPGAVGTLDELMSTLAEMTVRRDYTKKIIVVNVGGLFTPILNQLELFIDKELADRKAFDCIICVESGNECVEKLKEIKE